MKSYRGDIVDVPILEARLDGARSNLCPCPRQGCWNWVIFKAPPKLKLLPVLFPGERNRLRLKYQSLSPHKSIFSLVKEHLGRNSQAVRNVVLAISKATAASGHQRGPSIPRLRVGFLYQNSLLFLKTSRLPLAGVQNNMSC